MLRCQWFTIHRVRDECRRIIGSIRNPSPSSYLNAAKRLLKRNRAAERRNAAVLFLDRVKPLKPDMLTRWLDKGSAQDVAQPHARPPCMPNSARIPLDAAH